MVRNALLIALVGMVLTQAKAPGPTVQAGSRTIDYGPDDPVARDSKHYHVELENDHVRVVRVRYGPRESGILHEHRCGRVSVNLTPLHQRLRTPDGQTSEPRAAAGSASWSMPAKHSDENLENSPLEVVYVDVKSACPNSTVR